MSKGIRVIIADDHPLMRKGLQMTFQAVADDFTLVGEAADGASALRLVEELQPDVVLMDIRMPSMDGLEALEHIRDAWPQVAVVILTTYNDDELVLCGLQAGACGYLLKDCDLETLLDAIRTAARGDTLLFGSIFSPEGSSRLGWLSARHAPFGTQWVLPKAASPL